MQLKHWDNLMYKTGAMDLFKDASEDDIVIKKLKTISTQNQARHAGRVTIDSDNIVKIDIY